MWNAKWRGLACRDVRVNEMRRELEKVLHETNQREQSLDWCMSDLTYLKEKREPGTDTSR
jgi:hypothetical protein